MSMSIGKLIFALGCVALVAGCGEDEIRRSSGRGGGNGGGAFTYPNGRPELDTLYFSGTCDVGFCEEAVFGPWHVGSLTQCDFDGTNLSLRTSAITDGAAAFSFQVAVGLEHTYALDPETTSADWTLPDGASAFLFFDDETIDTKSSGSISFESCGLEVAGTFSFLDLCEYHSCNMGDAWVANVTGAFRCEPTQSVDCAL